MSATDSWRRSIQLHRLLLVASVAVPAVAFLFVAAAIRQDTIRAEQQNILRATDVAYEHTRNVFQTAELVLGRIADRVRGADWDAIQTPEMNAFLAELKRPLEHAVSIWISDADGFIRAGSQPWAERAHIRDRDHYRVFLERPDQETFVGSVFVGRTTGAKSFAIARRLPTRDGSFGGVIHIAFSPDYFEAFFRELMQERGYAAAVARTDGQLLARNPPPAEYGVVPRDNLVMRSILSSPERGAGIAASPVDGRERIYAYRLVADYSIWVAAGMETAVLLDRWYRSLLPYALITGLSSLTLLLVSWLALRRTLALRGESEQRLDAEKRLFHAQKLEGLGQLTGGVAHDFNNLLAVVLGNISLAKRRIDPDNHDVHRFLDRAIQGADRGAQLTQHLLSFARRQELRPRSVDLAGLVKDVTRLMQRTLGGAVGIDTQFPAGLPRVEVDPNHLELALLNLAVNARDAMPDGGTISISAGAVIVDDDSAVGLKPGEYVVLTVADSGTGMDAATLARATEPFFTTKLEGKGTGLGLAAVEGLAAQSGGTFRLASEVGVGTTAEIWLPVATEAAYEVTLTSPEETRVLQPRTVLVVDDDALVAAGTVDMLAEMGHTTFTAHSGEAALDLLARYPEIDTVITDQAMPKMTGTELARRIREQRPWLPILLISGHTKLPPGTDPGLPVLTKPFGPTQLARMLTQIVGQRTQAA